jgi:hypothetical protein
VDEACGVHRVRAVSMVLRRTWKNDMLISFKHSPLIPSSTSIIAKCNQHSTELSPRPSPPPPILQPRTLPSRFHEILIKIPPPPFKNLNIPPINLLNIQINIPSLPRLQPPLCPNSTKRISNLAAPPTPSVSLLLRSTNPNCARTPSRIYSSWRCRPSVPAA